MDIGDTAHKVNVKWGKDRFEDVEIDAGQPPSMFKIQLFSLTGVEPDRQKLMIKGKTIQDESWPLNFTVQDGITFMMMGSKGPLPEAPVQRAKFMEDMTDVQLAQEMDLPVGLHNLGNTCYMNSTLQCLRSVDELTSALSNVPEGSNSLAVSIKNTFQAMKQHVAASLPPYQLLAVLHATFPQFAEKDNHGQLQQQDANECWVQMVRVLQQAIPLTAAEGATERFVSKYFGIMSEVTLKCKENEDEAPTNSSEELLQLSCFINQDVRYVHTGLKNRMTEELIKFSPTMDRDASYVKSSLLSRIPAYLAVQMVRFFYKEKEKVNAKILKDVKFTQILDVFDYCTPELKEKLVPKRLKFKELEDAAVDAVKESTVKEVTKDAAEVEYEPYSFADDEGSNDCGYYELQAVLTHKGRTSNSGHYVAWCRKSSGNSDHWIMFDDDKVIPVHIDDILKLSGGGDWHSAYVLLYGPKKLPKH